MADDMNFNPTTADFEALLNESLGGASDFAEGTVIKGKVVGIEKDVAIIDIGLKTEGRISVKEFGVDADGKATLKVGDTVEVFLERVENALGEAVISREKAKREEAWTRLEEVFARNEPVNGAIVGRVKGGFTVDLGGAVAFLPGSQVDIRPVRDVTPLMNLPQPFQVLKMDRKRGNIVVSRRSILEESRAEARTGLISSLAEGQIVDGTVKNITDYGAFVDLGGIDGLLHVTDMSYKRVNHPSEVLNIGDVLRVQIVRINRDTQRISLGMKQLEADPWTTAAAKYAVDTKHKGRVTNITEYGAFVELEAGIEGLVHVSEMSWVKKNVHPGKIVSTSQEVEVIVLEVDEEKRRISLGLKQAQRNPWEVFAETNPVGTIVEGEVKNATEFGLFIGLDGDVDGMAHMSDIAWGMTGEGALARHHKGERVSARVLEVDIEKERISLGIKQLDEQGGTGAATGTRNTSGGDWKKNDIVTVTVVAARDGGLDVKIGEDGPDCYIKRNDLSRDREDQKAERFQPGQKVDAMVVGFEKGRKPMLSIKALQITEEKEAVAQYGTSDSGATLGNILGAAFNKAREESEKN